MKNPSLKVLTELQKDLFKTVQDQIKALEERVRAFITLGSGALAAVALVAKPDIFLTSSQPIWLKLLGGLSLLISVLLLIFAFLSYRNLATPSLIDFPNPDDIEKLSDEEDEDEHEVQRITLNAYTVIYKDAYNLLILKASRSKSVSLLVLIAMITLLFYLASSVWSQIFP